MENNQNRIISILIITGFALGVIFGIGGSSVKDLVLQSIFYEISSLGIIVAAVLLAGRLFRKGEDLVSAGFMVFALGEIVMNVGVAPAASEVAMGSFGAGMALYVPAFLMISLPKFWPLLVRITGVLCTIPFAIAAVKIFLGQNVPSTSLFPSAGYAFLSLTMIGIIFTMIKRKNQA